METKIIIAGNCIMCGEKIKMVARRGNTKSQDIFFCPGCRRKVMEKNYEAKSKEESNER